jgi:hypothetical protein
MHAPLRGAQSAPHGVVVVADTTTVSATPPPCDASNWITARDEPHHSGPSWGDDSTLVEVIGGVRRDLLAVLFDGARTLAPTTDNQAPSEYVRLAAEVRSSRRSPEPEVRLAVTGGTAERLDG